MLPATLWTMGPWEADRDITQQDLHAPTEGCNGMCSAHLGHHQS